MLLRTVIVVVSSGGGCGRCCGGHSVCSNGRSDCSNGRSGLIELAAGIGERVKHLVSCRKRARQCQQLCDNGSMQDIFHRDSNSPVEQLQHA